MTFIGLFTILNAMMSGVVTLFMTFMLVRFGNALNFWQRLGCGLMGGTAFLRIPPILDISNHGTPFDMWPSSLLLLGVLSYGGGAMWRMWGHEWRNAEARRQAERHFGIEGPAADRAAKDRRGKK